MIDGSKISNIRALLGDELDYSGLTVEQMKLRNEMIKSLMPKIKSKGIILIFGTGDRGRDGTDFSFRELWNK